MAQAAEVSDVDHFWGGDLRLSPTGDLGRVSTVQRSTQRVLRRLLTNRGDYLAHLDYGASVPGRIGGALNLDELTATVRGQMLLEESVLQDPQPVVEVQPILNGVTVAVRYLVAPDRRPAALSFDVAR